MPPSIDLSWVTDYLKTNGLATLIVIFAGWFWVRHLWPFLRDKVYPDMQHSREAEQKEREASRENISQLRTSVQELPGAIAGGVLHAMQQAMTPQFDQSTSAMTLIFNEAKEQTISQVSASIIPIAAQVNEIKGTLTAFMSAEKERDEALMARVGQVETHLVQTMITLHGKAPDQHAEVSK